jgi:hypothetical protein
MFSITSLPPSLHNLISSFSRCFSKNNRGTLFNDMSAPEQDLDPDEWLNLSPTSQDPVPRDTLTEDVLSSFRQWQQHNGSTNFSEQVKRLREFESAGDLYKPYNIGEGDSHIAFKFDKDKEWRAGRIRDIFSVATSTCSIKTFLAVDEYAPVEAEIASIDPYRKYPDRVAGRIFKRSWTKFPQIICKSELLCHCAIIMPRIDGFPYNNGIVGGPADYLLVRPCMKVSSTLQ